MSRAFTPRRIAASEPRIREITDGLLDTLLAASGDEPVDLGQTLASPLPTAVIAELMRIPPERRNDFKRWSDNLINGLLTGGSITKMLLSAAQISWFFARVIRARRRHPGDDLISLLVTGDSDEALNVAELINFCVLLPVAGNERTTNLISNAMLAMFDQPNQWQRLVEDPELAPAAVEETLRYDGPGQGLLRIAVTDINLSGTLIPAGARVLPLIASANRDPRHWDDPDSFRLDRKTNDHIAFGSGIHFCIGSALARIETRAALEALARQTPGIAPAGQPVRINSPVLRGLRALPVSLLPKPRATHIREVASK